MKLFVALMLCSFSVFAAEIDATAAAQQVLPPAIYDGVDAQGEECRVAVSADDHGLVVVATAGQTSVSRSILKGSTYRFNPAQRLFLSSDKLEDRESVLRTLAVEAKTQYVVVARSRNGIEQRVECVVDLK
jgi:hypothetical protein